MAGQLPSETLDLQNTKSSPSDFAPNHSPSSAEDHFVLFDASRELLQQLETAGSFCLDCLAERFTQRSHLKDVMNEAEGIFKRMELLDQACIFEGRSHAVAEGLVDRSNDTYSNDDVAEI